MIRLGFLGVGSIGLEQMRAILATGRAEAIAICEPDPEMAVQALKLAPAAKQVGSLTEMISCFPDGIVIATPSAIHAPQCIEALRAGIAVFCHKPPGRTAAEVETVIDAARAADRLLGVDLPYRHTKAMQAIRDQVRSSSLGKVFAADLVFHNSSGPESAWLWDRSLSGGGCLIDVGGHLVDLALWLLDFPAMEQARGRQFRDGRVPRADEVEDYAAGSFDLVDGTHVRIACSWNLSCGTDAVFRATFHGTEGSAEMHNEKPGLTQFNAELFKGHDRHVLASPPDDWACRPAADWVEKLKAGARFERSTEGLVESARVLDRIYGRDIAEAAKPAAFLSV